MSDPIPHKPPPAGAPAPGAQAPPPVVQVKLFWLDLRGEGTIGIVGLIVLVLVLLGAGYLFRDLLPTLFQATAELAGKFARSRQWM